MKTPNQVISYISHCRFSVADWKKVAAYCRKYFKGIELPKAERPLSGSTFEQFVRWVDSGVGAGDIVRYGKTTGIVKESVPLITELCAYCDYEGNLIVQDMAVMEPERLSLADDERRAAFLGLLVGKKLCYSTEHGKLVEMYTPRQKSYIALTIGDDVEPSIGMYSHSEGYNYKFFALLRNGKMEFDCWVNCECTPLRKADEGEMYKFHKALADEKFAYSAAYNKFIYQTQRKANNLYFYLNDAFNVVSDRDNGADRHQERFEAGNYFFDQAEAILFARKVKKLRGKDS